MARLYRPNLRFMRQTLEYDMRYHFAEGCAGRARFSTFFGGGDRVLLLGASRRCVTNTACAFRPATSAMIPPARALSAISRSGVTAPIAVMPWAMSRPLPDHVRLAPPPADPPISSYPHGGPTTHVLTAMTLPGLNVQAPWAQALISGRKVIETHFYPMPAKWTGQPLAIIETPGTTGDFKRRIAGLVVFGPSWRYTERRHLPEISETPRRSQRCPVRLEGGQPSQMGLAGGVGGGV